ncbi:hypothetical protein, partial [Streptomyces koelreuteriae]|uniref:hypothetical protein n=1 Tax=Streptomyces koelreuteriae TaxID=2838015 RepID=UPI001BE8A507
MRSKQGVQVAQPPASAHAERERNTVRNTRAQHECSLAHRAAMGHPLRGKVLKKVVGVFVLT